jgi:hypothetical protein
MACRLGLLGVVAATAGCCLSVVSQATGNVVGSGGGGSGPGGTGSTSGSNSGGSTAGTGTGGKCVMDAGAAVACAGTVTVNTGLLGQGTDGMAVAASMPGPLGVRVILASSGSLGCSVETLDPGFYAPYGACAPIVVILFMLEPGISPGTYPSTSESVEVYYSYDYFIPDAGFTGLLGPYGGGGGSPISGSVTFSSVGPQGVSGSYHFDFGPSDKFGELVEDGRFTAPSCELCGSAPTCNGVVCDAGEFCQRGCGGPRGLECLPLPSCTGPPSCANCAIDQSAICGTELGQECYAFDGFSMVCDECLP